MALETQSRPENQEKPTLRVTERDIVFACPSCRGELVVDREGIGMELPCAHCGSLLVVPERSTPRLPASPTQVPNQSSETIPPATQPSRRFDFAAMGSEQVTRRLDELKHQLKENMSQHTEMRGHVNRATIELHRLQLRLKTLQERQADIEAELVAARAWLELPAA